MNSKDYFKDIYNDFFNIEINIETKEEEENTSKEDYIESVNNLYITDESKNMLNKMIEYIKKYNNKEEKNYIPFRIILEIDNDEERKKVENIIFELCKNLSYIKSNEKTNISLYNINKEKIEVTGSFITITNLNGLDLLDNNDKEKFYFNLEESLKTANNIILISDKENNLYKFFLGKEYLKNKYILFKIKGTSPDNQDIYNQINEKLDLKDEDKIKLLDYINETYNSDLDYTLYINKIIREISFNKEIPKAEEEKSIDEIFKELNELVGLNKVKKVLYDLVDVINLKKKAKDDLNIKDINLHMVFLGNPGTGKTTIARIISGILYNLKLIKEDKLVEVSSKDLVAEYVGQTAPKTMSVIEKSLNGVLFIDEAYSLAVKNDNSYNAEAIATLIQAMENYRDKLVVIFAGYTKEMQDFLNSNSGIVSRIGYTLEFDDYTTEELIQIFLGMMKKSGFIVKDDAVDYLRTIIDENRNMKNFGNARFIRNIYEKSIIKHASNTKNKKRKDILKTITKEDISIENLNLK
ncbi:MAG: AAA family ATPase [Bacilli bacterium]|nr:AAA family ATPase [Bacilli bacterium]